MNANGMLGISAAVNELFGGNHFWMTSVTMPMRKEIPTAPGRERSRAATTAAKAAVMRVVMPAGVRPWDGATRIPARPARVVLTAHTPSATRDGFVPERE